MMPKDHDPLVNQSKENTAASAVERAASALKLAAEQAWFTASKPGLDGQAHLHASLEEVEAGLRTLTRELRSDPSGFGSETVRHTLALCRERMERVRVVSRALATAVEERLARNADGVEYKSSGSGYRPISGAADRGSWVCEA